MGNTWSRTIAEDAEIKLAALDVFLGDGVVIIFLMNEGDAFPELLVIFDKRGLGNAERSLLLERLYQDGKAQAARAQECGGPGE
jgi:hypothetical protein